jgi:hypothetical protein
MSHSLSIISMPHYFPWLVLQINRWTNKLVIYLLRRSTEADVCLNSIYLPEAIPSNTWMFSFGTPLHLICFRLAPFLSGEKVVLITHAVAHFRITRMCGRTRSQTCGNGGEERNLSGRKKKDESSALWPSHGGASSHRRCPSSNTRSNRHVGCQDPGEDEGVLSPCSVTSGQVNKFDAF